MLFLTIATFPFSENRVNRSESDGQKGHTFYFSFY